MRVLILSVVSLALIAACTDAQPPTPTPDILATVTAAVEAALPTETPTRTPDIEATLEYRLQATISAIPTSTPQPPPATSTPEPTLPPAPTTTATPTSKSILPTGIRIDTLSATRAVPQSLLSITASGFESNSDLLVRFFDDGGYSVDVTAHVSSTSLKVSVPPFVDLTTGEFGPGVVSVQLIQKSTTDTLKSNPISGFHIEDLPSSTEPIGTVTVAYLDGIIQLIQDAKEHLTILEEFSAGEDSNPELVASLDALRTVYIAAKKEVEAVIADPSKPVIFAQIGDDSLELNITTISIIDRLIGSIIKQVESGSTKRTALRMGNGFPMLVDSKKQALQFVLLNWKQEEPDFVLVQSQQEQPKLGPLSLEGLDPSSAIKRVETWGNSAGTMLAVTSLYNKSWSKFPKNPGLKTATGGAVNTLSAVHFVGFTVVPATMLLVEDLSAITAGTNKESFEQAAPVIKRYLRKVGPGVVDALTGIPILGVTDTSMGLLIDVTERILGLEIEDVSGKGTLISQISTSYFQRNVGYDSGRPDPNCSGLNLIKGIACKGEPTPTPTPYQPPPPPIAPTPTATATPTTTSMPTPIPVPIAVPPFTGTWVGRYSGTILYTPPECKSTIRIEGPITAKLVQEGTRVTGTVTLGGTEVEIVRNGSDCKVINRKDDTFTIVGEVSGDTLSYGGPTSSFSVTKTSENSADGTSRDEFIVISFFIGRLR